MHNSWLISLQSSKLTIFLKSFIHNLQIAFYFHSKAVLEGNQQLMHESQRSDLQALTEDDAMDEMGKETQLGCVYQFIYKYFIKIYSSW